METERRGSEPFADPSQVLELADYGLEILAKLNAARTSQCFTDAILVVGQEEFPCHRNVLAMSSPYFQAMFSSDLRESRESSIIISEISAWTMRRVIDFAYTGRVEITVDNAQDLLAAGSLFQYPEIVDGCCDFLTNHLHPSNSLGIEDFAHLHSCSKLETDAHQFTLENFTQVVEYDEFESLPPARLATYLSSDLIDVRTEECVFEALVKWIYADLDARRQQACMLMEHIRLVTVDVEYLEHVVEQHPLVTGCDQCSKLVEEAKRYHETRSLSQQGQRRRSMQTETLTPRPSTVAKEVMVLVGGLNNINYLMSSVEMYDTVKDKWTLLPDMPQTPSWFSCTALNNDVYVCGGILDGHIISNVWRFESSKRDWSEGPRMLTARARHASAVWNSRLFVVGGITLSVDSKIAMVEKIEAYDPVASQWSIVGQSPFPRKQSHLVPYNETLVEIGGTQGGASVHTMESYLCEGQEVNYSGEQFILPECIQFAQVVVLNSVFYIMWEDSKKVISLSPEKRSFRRLPDMHHAHIHAGAAVLNGKIYVAGGLIDSKPSRIVECFDPATNQWTVVRNMRQARACHGAVTIQMS